MNFADHLRETSPFKSVPSHHLLASQQIDRWLRDEFANLMLLMPVQHGKSFVFSDRLPSYILGRDPLRHVLLTAYGNPLVQRAIVQNRNTMRGEYWQKEYGWPIGEKDTQNALLLDVPGQDGRLSLIGAPLNGSIAGHTVDYAIVDDICRNEADALSPKIRQTVADNFFSVIAPRSKKICLVTTPWHLSDLAMENLRLARTNPQAKQWMLVVLAATNSGTDSYIEDTSTGVKQYLEPYDSLWPEVHPLAEIEEIKATIRERKFNALYMCRPSVGGDCLFPPGLWKELGNVSPIAINWAWDFASGKSGAKNDYTVGCCVALMNNGFYAVLDVFRGKPDFILMKRLVFQKWVETYEKYKLGAQVFIEDASAGQQMLQEFANLNAVQPTAVRPIPVIPTQNKEMRAEAIASAQNSGLVCLPKDAPWREEFIRELAEFPLAEHDDQVDAYTWAQAGFVRGEKFFKVPEERLCLMPQGETEDNFVEELLGRIGYDSDGFDNEFEIYKKRQGY
jgi:predicted phage terminase large subunit-like protein